MTIRLTKIVMSACLAAFALLVAFDNLFDWNANYVFVSHVMSMDTTFRDPAIMGRAVTSSALWTLEYSLIIAAEALTGILFATGAVRLVQARGDLARFAQEKRWVAAGATVAFALWFFGFMVAGGEWFAMWQSAVWNGQEGAFRFYITVLAVLIFVNQKDE